MTHIKESKKTLLAKLPKQKQLMLLCHTIFSKINETFVRGLRSSYLPFLAEHFHHYIDTICPWQANN